MLDEKFENQNEALQTSESALAFLSRITSQKGMKVFPTRLMQVTEMIMTGFEPTCTLVKPLILKECIYSTWHLVQKSKLKLNVKDCVMLIGIVDECKALKPNQVVVCFTNDHGVKETWSDTQVVIARHPIYYPGEIQKFDAVVPPFELKHLENVIIFNRTATAPLSDMLGGGDLDGDLYFVSKLPQLLKITPIPPLDYEKIKMEMGAKTAFPSIAAEDMVSKLKEYFINYNDQIGSFELVHRLYAATHKYNEPTVLDMTYRCIAMQDAPKTGAEIDLPKYDLDRPNPMFHEIATKLDAKFLEQDIEKQLQICTTLIEQEEKVTGLADRLAMRIVKHLKTLISAKAMEQSIELYNDKDMHNFDIQRSIEIQDYYKNAIKFVAQWNAKWRNSNWTKEQAFTKICAPHKQALQSLLAEQVQHTVLLESERVMITLRNMFDKEEPDPEKRKFFAMACLRQHDKETMHWLFWDILCQIKQSMVQKRLLLEQQELAAQLQIDKVPQFCTSCIDRKMLTQVKFVKNMPKK